MRRETRLGSVIGPALAISGDLPHIDSMAPMLRAAIPYLLAVVVFMYLFYLVLH
jgi:hypothetical protein